MKESKDVKAAVLGPVPDGVIPVDEWHMTDEDAVIKYLDKSIIVPFSMYFGQKLDKKRDYFYVLYKDSYVKKFPHIIRYLNYFIKFYDTDGELVMNYLKCKNMIDSTKVKMSRKTFIDWIYRKFVTPSMYNKVFKMVEDNYRIDLTQNKDSSRTYSESLEFTNRHAKIFMLVSIFIKMLIPLVLHYISCVKGKKEIPYMVYYFKPLFTLVEKTEKVNLYAKLFNSVNVRVNMNENSNKGIWGKYEANSVDTVSYTEELLDKNLLVDNIFKYVFSKSVVAFNSVILDTQLEYRCVKNFNVNMKEISTEKDSEGLSYLDKLEMNTYKIDEGRLILSAVNIKDTIKRIKRVNKIHISKEELHYYLDNFKINKLSKILVFYYYARVFGGFNDLNHINLKQFVKLMLLMKKHLEAMGYMFMNQIICANVVGKINSRVIRNAKFVEKVKDSPICEFILDDQYGDDYTPKDSKAKAKAAKGEMIMGLLSALINTKFTIVDFDHQEALDDPVEINMDILSQEFLDYVSSI